MTNDVISILDRLAIKHGIDFAGYRSSVLQRRIHHRASAVLCRTPSDYLKYIDDHTEEIDFLLEALTINVSRFFRDPLTFDYIAEAVVPAIVGQKRQAGERSIRVWSAGCASGEEPYSMAILLREYLEKEPSELSMSVFGTDIDRKALSDAIKGRYPIDSIDAVRFGWVRKYFKLDKDNAELLPSIREAVIFSFYDILDPKTVAPAVSVYSGFDLVLCRNLLIYYDRKAQNRVLAKLCQALNEDGFLVLGNTEVPPEHFSANLKRVAPNCPIYQKVPTDGAIRLPSPRVAQNRLGGPEHILFDREDSFR